MIQGGDFDKGNVSAPKIIDIYTNFFLYYVAL